MSARGSPTPWGEDYDGCDGAAVCCSTPVDPALDHITLDHIALDLDQPLPQHGRGDGSHGNPDVADQPRLAWEWAPGRKTTASSAPKVEGKWWSAGPENPQSMAPSKRSDHGHIGRIMETELGKQLLGEERCRACQEKGHECWVYSEEGRRQISRPGDTCARCRVTAQRGGCSLSRRVRHQKTSPAPLPVLPRLAAKEALGSLGAGGDWPESRSLW